MTSERNLAVVGTNGPDPSQSEASYPSAEKIQKYVADHHSSFGRLMQGVFEFKTHSHAERLTSMLALNTPFPEKASMGIWELLSNAVEHGILGFDLEAKTNLILSGELVNEIERRQTLAPYKDRVAVAEFKVGQQAVVLKVTDQGNGFDFKNILDNDMPLDRPNGRGIKMAQQLCFDELIYHGNGNSVEAIMKFPED